MFLKPRTTISGHLGISIGDWIQYPFGILITALRVMWDFLGFGTFFTQAPHFSLAWGTLFWRGRRIFGYELL